MEAFANPFAYGSLSGLVISLALSVVGTSAVFLYGKEGSSKAKGLFSVSRTAFTAVLTVVALVSLVACGTEWHNFDPTGGSGASWADTAVHCITWGLLMNSCAALCLMHKPAAATRYGTKLDDSSVRRLYGCFFLFFGFLYVAPLAVLFVVCFSGLPMTIALIGLLFPAVFVIWLYRDCKADPVER